jgi:hypothetical protein
MEGESSAISGSQLNYRLITTPAAAGAIPPSTCPVTTHLLVLYQECLDNGVWARVLYEARDGVEISPYAKRRLHLHSSLDDDWQARGGGR